METPPIAFRLENIEIIQKSITRGNVAPNDEFNFEVKTQSAVDETNDVVIIVCAISIAKVSELQRKLALFIIATAFKVQDFKTAFKKNDEGKVILPTSFENGLKTICLSTSRGIIFANLADTYLKGVNLPIIYADSLKTTPGNLFEPNNVANE